jgi:L-aspartate oxidase
VDEGPARVNELIALGAAFDRDPDGRLQLAREGGHSLPRIVHAGGAATGAEIERTLVDAVRESGRAVYERTFALDLIVDGGRCSGVVAADSAGSRIEVRAANVLMATGGYGQVFDVTTNPTEATGDGVAMAIRAGVAVADVEFEQFHPTALHHPVMPRPLLTEALRGHGALLRDSKGDRFVDELESRDKVSRAVTARMLDQSVDHLWLDATGLERFAERFPTIAAELSKVGLDPATDWLPIAPAAHYSCGGILADLNGASSLPGLWVAGEASCNGVMGANRLASNSLLDGMVFGPRVVEAIDRGVDGPEATGAMRARLGGGDIGGRALDVPSGNASTVPDREVLQRTMTTFAGVLRSAESLDEAAAACAGQVAGDDPGAWELRNLATVGRVLCAAALAREESRGAHTRTDFPDEVDPYRVRLIANP